MTTKEIYDLIYASKRGEETYNNILKVVEANLDVIDNDIVFKDSEKQNYSVVVLSVYAEILNFKQRYRKSLPFLNKAIASWENLFDTDDNFIDKEKNWYRSLRLYRGVGYYRTNQIKKAKQDFIWLTNQDPENENYRNWLISAKNSILGNIANWIMYSGFIALGTTMLLPRQERAIKEYLFIFIGIVYITVAFLKIIEWYRNKQKKAKSN